MKAVAINDFYDLILTDDEGNMLNVTDMEPTDYVSEATIANGIADEDPDAWETLAREASKAEGFELGAIHDNGIEKWFEVG